MISSNRPGRAGGLASSVPRETLPALRAGRRPRARTTSMGGRGKVDRVARQRHGSTHFDVNRLRGRTAIGAGAARLSACLDNSSEAAPWRRSEVSSAADLHLEPCCACGAIRMNSVLKDVVWVIVDCALQKFLLRSRQSRRSGPCRAFSWRY